MKRALFLIVTLLLLGPGAWAAGALPPCPKQPDSSAEARRLASKWWRNGVKLFNAGANLDAIKAWTCANRLAPNPLALYNIARAAELAGKHKLAHDHYRRFLAARPKTDKRQKIEASIRRLKEKLRPRRTEPTPRRTEPTPRRTEPTPRRTVPAPRRIAPTPLPRRNGPPPRPGRPDRPGRGKRIAGWVTIGLSAALTGLAAVLAGLAGNEKSAVENAAPNTPWNPDLADHEKRFESLRTGVWISAGLGAAALATGTVLLILGHRAKKPERATVTPTLLPGGAGVSLELRF